MSPRRAPSLTPLLDWEPSPAAIGYGDDVVGRGALDNQIARLIGRALRDARDAGLSRAEIAISMTTCLGRDIKETTLDKWSSEAAEGHRISLDAFIALIKTTGQTALLGFIPAIFGFSVVPDHYVDLIELQQIEEHEAEVAARKAVLKAKTRARR